MHHRVHHGAAALGDQGFKPPLGDVDGADLRPEVERHHVRQPRIGDERVLDLGLQPPARDDLQKVARRFLVEIAGADAETAFVDAADIGMVQHVRRPEQNPAVEEQRAGDHEVALVQSAEKGIVGHEDVAVLDLAGEFQNALQRLSHRADMDERAGPGRAQLSIGCEQADIEVVSLDHDRGGGDRLDRNALFVVDLPQAVLDHLEGDRIDDGLFERPRGLMACGHAFYPSGSIAILP